ncbi:esterase/lipase family protein [Rheinheimera fenheensis]|uniref:esterase/lipase family protein n=1 Tax=Rheinheimera fenheensis TaxID=3152295 RepID=UPI00325CA9AF
MRQQGIWRWLISLMMVLGCQACSQSKYIYWQQAAPVQTEAINGFLAYQYVAMGKVADSEIAEYCEQLTTQRTSGYQLFLLQLSCAERWLAQELNAEQQQQAVAYYNQSLMPLVRAAVTKRDTRPLNLVLQLKVDPDELGVAFETLVISADLAAYDPFIKRQQSTGLGIAVVGQRANRGNEQDKYYPPEGIFRPLTVMPVALDFSNPVLPVLTLRAVTLATDNGQAKVWTLGHQQYPLNFDPAAAYLCLAEVAIVDQLEKSGLFNADKVEDKLGIYAIEPLRPDKIPVLMIHGLNSSPLIWRRLSWAILSNPNLANRYQIWHAFYPSGPPPFFNAMRLRQRTDELLNQISPDLGAIAANNMVLVGHSMGGIISKTFVQTSETVLWDRTFYKTPADLPVDEATRQTLRDIFIFTAKPYVKTVVFLDTPHRGADTADGWIGRLASALITLPGAIRNVFSAMWLSLTSDDIKPEMRNYMRGAGPNSVDVLSPRHPLTQALNELPFNVPVYSVIGNANLAQCTARKNCELQDDTVVPYASAHLPQAAEELVVQSEHNSYQSEQAIAFITGILASQAGKM